MAQGPVGACWVPVLAGVAVNDTVQPQRNVPSPYHRERVWIQIKVRVGCRGCVWGLGHDSGPSDGNMHDGQGLGACWDRTVYKVIRYKALEHLGIELCIRFGALTRFDLREQEPNKGLEPGCALCRAGLVFRSHWSHAGMVCDRAPHKGSIVLVLPQQHRGHNTPPPP